MLLPALPIARTTFIEALRQPIFMVLILLGGLGILLSTWSTGYSMGFSEAAEVSADNRQLLDINMATVFVTGVLMAGFIATSSMSREIENKTVLTIVSKPIGRPVVVLGKYIGVTGAVMVGVLILSIFLFLSLRHKVMSTAADDPDWPVIIFSVAGLLIAAFAGVWGNFFYGWSFPQTVSLWLLPLQLVAFGLTLFINKKWALQPIATDLKPQTTLACLCLIFSMPVLCAIAVAASTRLGQVMTIVLCFGVFVLGLLSTVFIGRHAYTNTPLSMIGEARPTAEMYRSFADTGHVYEVALKTPPPREPKPGDSFYYGPAANGLAMVVPPFRPFTGDTAELARDRVLTAEPAIVVTAYDAKTNSLTIKHIGSGPLGISRPPQAGDFVFAAPTRVNFPALAIWGMLPNLHFFWLLDAVAQNMPIPFSHVALVGLYALCQIVAFLSVAILLFQRRDVG